MPACRSTGHRTGRQAQHDPAMRDVVILSTSAKFILSAVEVLSINFVEVSCAMAIIKMILLQNPEPDQPGINGKK